MTCTCNANPNQGSPSTTARTVIVPAGSIVQLDGANFLRRTALIVNRSAGSVWVAFGGDDPTEGTGVGIEVQSGETFQANTVAAVKVLNAQAVAASVGYVAELD